MQRKGKFVLLSIDEFDAWLLDRKFSRSVTLIQNHHTMVPDYGQFDGANHFRLLAGMENYHVTQRGFSEIAQNLTTFPDGTIAVCRSLEKIPAGIKGANQAGICIEHLGSFDSGKDSMRAEHRDAIVRTNALLCRAFNVLPSAESIVYHHWYDLDSGRRTDGTGNTKSCPGTAFFGGNSVQSAQANFIPLVATALQSLATVVTVQAIRIAEVSVETTLNVRAGAGATYPVVKRLVRGALVKVYEEVAGWCRIHASDQQWVSRKFLKAIA